MHTRKIFLRCGWEALFPLVSHKSHISDPIPSLCILQPARPVMMTGRQSRWKLKDFITVCLEPQIRRRVALKEKWKQWNLMLVTKSTPQSSTKRLFWILQYLLFPACFTISGFAEGLGRWGTVGLLHYTLPLRMLACVRTAKQSED